MDFDGSSGDNASNEHAREAALAVSPLLHAEEARERASQIFRLVPREPDAEHIDKLYRDVLRALTPAVADVARFKNVTINPDMCTWMARRAMESLTADDMADLVKVVPHAVMRARLAISHTLDLFAAIQVGYIVIHTLGAEPPEPAEMLAVAENWIGSGADPANPSDKIWPDLVEAAQQHVAALSGADNG